MENETDLAVDSEVEITTTWGFPPSIEPHDVMFFGESEFALTLECDAKTKKPILCKSKNLKAVYTLGSALSVECFAKIEKFYPKPDYSEILVHESGNPKRNLNLPQNTSKTTNSEAKNGNTASKPGTLNQNKRNSSRHKNADDDSSISLGSTCSDATKSVRSVPAAPCPGSPSSAPTQLPPPRSPAQKRAHTLSSSLSGKLIKQEPGSSPPSTTYNDLGLTDSSGAYTCIHCPQTFMTMSEMKVHCLNEHDSNKAFKCKVCNKCFRNSRCLLLHTFTHTGEKHYTCLYCPLQFRASGHRNSHMRIMHQDDEPYKCDQCAATFRTCNEMKRHVRSDHKRKQTKCSDCMVDFHYADQLEAHVCTMKNRVKKFDCGACGEKFYRLANLVNHAKFCKYIDKTDLKCEKCGMDFVSAARCSIHKTYFCTGETSPGVERAPGSGEEAGDSVGQEEKEQERPGVQEIGVGTAVETGVGTGVLDQDVLAETVNVESQKVGAAEGEPDLNMLLGHKF